ncbi:MAG TPA: transcriptional repressor LexA [Candidatus Polarisedimenticolaceae bacterium]|nr:transcriptional repressor LexA [Candidatus Polarisedimenticolaceae bacterium]
MGRTPAGQTREKVFRFVRDRLAAGQPPTVREVMEAFDFRSPQTAREHLDALVEEGRLGKEPGVARGFRLPGRGEPPTVMVPLLGRVPAGPLDTAVEDLEGHLPVQTRRAPGDLFSLRVRGDSMKDAGIFDGDVVVVRRQPRADSGEIVVALVGDEATVKRLRIKRGRIELHPENDAYAPIVPEPGEVKVLGKVVEVRRILE